MFMAYSFLVISAATLEATKGAAEKPSLSGALKENAGKVKSQPVKDAPAKNGQER